MRCSNNSTGDFTRSLVQNPPKTLWTRELKVRVSCRIPYRVTYVRSLPEFPTRRRYISVVSASALVPASEPPFPHVLNLHTGKFQSFNILISQLNSCPGI